MESGRVAAHYRPQAVDDERYYPPSTESSTGTLFRVACE